MCKGTGWIKGVKKSIYGLSAEQLAARNQIQIQNLESQKKDLQKELNQMQQMKILEQTVVNLFDD